MDTTDAGLPFRIERRALRGLAALPSSVTRRLAGAPIRIDGQTLNEQVQLMLRLMKLAPGPTFEELPLEQGRAQISAEAFVFGDDLALETVEDIVLPGPDGTALPARVYRPEGLPTPCPALVYFHGGGWVLGDLDSGDSACRVLAAHAGIAVISVDYRLAPENPFPAAVDDAVAAFRHVVAEAAGYGIDPTAVAVGGESAGGNLAAVVAQVAHAEPGPAPAFQLLFNPVTDLSSKHPSYQLFSDGFFLTDAQMDWYRGHYLTDEAQALDPKVSPLLAADLTGLAPAYVMTAGFDPLRDEGEAYAGRLREAGVQVALRRHPSLIHGIINATGVGRYGRDALIEAAGALQLGLGSAREQVRV